jgi:signal transduction histidine kinase
MNARAPAAFVQRIRNAASLKTRVLLLVAILLVAGIWALAAQVAETLKHDLQKTLSDQLSNMVGYVADDFDEGVRLRLSVLEEMANTVTPDLLNHPDKAQATLDQRGISTMLFPTGVFIADRSGTIIADAGAVIPGRHGRSVADRDYFRDSLSGVKPVVSRPLMGRVTRSPTIFFSVPIRDVDGTAAGVLAASVETLSDSMFGEIEKLAFGNNGYSIVFSPRDRLIIAATDRTRVLQPIPARGVVPLMDRRIDEGFEGVGITVNSSGTEVLTANRNMKTTGWIVVSAIPTNEAFTPIAILRQHVYLAALVVTAVVTLLLWFALKYQLGPLQEAGRAMQRMSDGVDSFTTLPIKRQDEIGRLVKHFNRLVLERQRNERDLAHHRDNLQDLVHEQTADLLLAKEAAEAANRAKSQFLAKMSLELRTPLQTLLSFSRLGQVLVERASPQKLASYFSHIEAAGRELLQMINDLLDLSKIEAGKMTLDAQSGDLGAIAREVGRELEPLFWAKGLSVDFRIREGTPRAELDTRRISQVVRNLYSNAIRYSPTDGGMIRVEVSPADLPAANGGGEPAGRQPGVRLTVADQGQGIPVAELERVFEKFTPSTKTAPGGGLGLAICKEIVEAHGGRIRAANDAAGGAVFEVLLPLDHATRRSAAKLT